MFKIILYCIGIIVFAQELNDDQTPRDSRSQKIAIENTNTQSDSLEDDLAIKNISPENPPNKSDPLIQQMDTIDQKAQDPLLSQNKPQEQSPSNTKTEQDAQKDLIPQDLAQKNEIQTPKDSISQNPINSNQTPKITEDLRAISPQELKQKIDLCEEKNEKKICFQVGMLYYQGLSTYGQKLKEALYFFDRSCDVQQGLGCYQAGIISAKYEHYQHAFIFLEKACQSGDLRGCKNLGILYYNGWGTTKNIYKATDLFKTSCKQGDKASCQKLYLALGNAYKEALNYIGAKKNYQIACDLGENEACEYVKAIELLEKQKYYENAVQNNILKKHSF